VYTRFEQHNQDFSDKAHAAAQSLVYPQLFKCHEDRLTFDSASVSDGGEKAILDGQMAVDRLVKVTVDGLRYPIEHTVQERFRRPGYRNYRDITITEWNHASNQPSELYKIKCGIFTYGYYHEDSNCFGDVIAVDVSAFLMAMTTGGLSYSKKTNRKRQDFICITFEALHEAGVVLAHMDEAKTAPVLQPSARQEFSDGW
jgi:hypothetical protein